MIGAINDDDDTPDAAYYSRELSLDIKQPGRCQPETDGVDLLLEYCGWEALVPGTCAAPDRCPVVELIFATISCM